MNASNGLFRAEEGILDLIAFHINRSYVLIPSANMQHVGAALIQSVRYRRIELYDRRAHVLLGIPFSNRAVIRATHHNQFRNRCKRINPMDMTKQRRFSASFLIPNAYQPILITCIYLRLMKEETSNKPPHPLSIELFHGHSSVIFA